MFDPVEGNLADKLVANYLRMLLFVIMAGFALVILKLFEVLGIVAAMALWVALRRSRSTQVGGMAYLVAVLFDLLEFPRTIVRSVKEGPRRWLKMGQMLKQRLMGLRPSVVLLERLTLVAVLCVSGYIRLYSAVVDPTPKMSDGDTLLAWIKYIDYRYLMHDGVYPQGMFFVLAVLVKFAVINPLYVLNYTGPLDSIMIILMMYYGTVRVTSSRTAGLIAVVLYGILGQHLLQFEWTRQSGSETQEFGFPLVFPVLYFLDRYFRDGRKSDLWIVFAGASDAGLIHPLSYLLTVMAALSVMAVYACVRFSEVRVRLLYGCLSGALSGLIALLPYGLAAIFHIRANQGAQSFLNASLSTSSQGASGAWRLPIPTSFDYLALVCILGLLTLFVIGVLKNTVMIPWAVSGIWGLMCYVMYEFGPDTTKSVILYARMIDLWGITEAFVIAVGIAALQKSFLQVAAFHRITTWVVVVSALVITIWTRPRPIMPYDVQWPDDVEAYLQIDRQFQSDNYMIVSPKFEYALVYGTGFQMDGGMFVQRFDATKRPITLYGQPQPDQSLAPYVFVYYYKHIFRVDQGNSVYEQYAPFYQKEALYNGRIMTWLTTLSRVNHQTFRKVYDGPNLEVYEIPVDIPKPTSLKKQGRA